MSKIYTRKGDKGTTSTIKDRKIPKNDPIIHAIGSIDELNSYIGLIYSVYPKSNLSKIQSELFSIGSILAGADLDINIDPSWLESEIDSMTQELKPLKNFILPAGSTLVCYCHIARAVCRRGERYLSNSNDDISAYINRLSDYLFTLARYVSHKNNDVEIIWKL